MVKSIWPSNAYSSLNKTFSYQQVDHPFLRATSEADVKADVKCLSGYINKYLVLPPFKTRDTV